MNKLVNQTQQQSTAVSTDTAASNPFTAAADVALQRNIVGELLKFSKGDWLVGQDNEEIPDGAQFVANMDELFLGWIRWMDNKPTDHIMGKVSQAYQPPRRSELGDNDESEWEVDDRGDSNDPWRLSYYLLMKGMSDGELYTFATGSGGGRKGIAILMRDYGKVLAQHPDEYPVVALAQSSYEHSNKAIGRVKEPRFDIVGWVGKDAFNSDLGENGDPEPAEEPAPEPAPAPKPKPVPVPDPAPKPQATRAMRGRI